jgi:acyl dehydratase
MEIEQTFPVGQHRTILVQVSPHDLTRFSELSGDFAPVHTDPDFARAAGFEGVVVHGAFLNALVSRLIGMEFPGPLAVLERMDISYRQPCYAPCELKISGTVKQVSEAVKSLILEISIVDDQERTLATGKTWHRILDGKE